MMSTWDPISITIKFKLDSPRISCLFWHIAGINMHQRSFMYYNSIIKWSLGAVVILRDIQSYRQLVMRARSRSPNAETITSRATATVQGAWKYIVTNAELQWSPNLSLRNYKNITNCRTSNLCLPDTSCILHTFAYYMFYLYVRWIVPFKAFCRAFCAIAGLGAKAQPPTHKSGALARASSWFKQLVNSFTLFQNSSSCSSKDLRQLLIESIWHVTLVQRFFNKILRLKSTINHIII